MFKCPKCKKKMVYDWILKRVLCINPLCGFTTTWEIAMDKYTKKPIKGDKKKK